MMSRKNENSKLPFNHKLFYLDITSNPPLKIKIDNCVKQLGGTVETFLDRKVRYVVTDKPQKDWPVDSKQAAANGPTTANATEKQQENKLELMGLTRGKMLATKAPSSSAKTKDVLETALRLNMKILTHRSILDFCKKYIKLPLDDVTAAEQLNEQEAGAAAKVRQLKAPFLKFEDKEERFAPVYKEFDTWPTVCMESSSSSLTNTNVTNLTANPQTPTVPKNFNTSKLLQPPMQKKRQRVFFCEICSKDFTNMIEHVQTEQHQIYMKNEENYKELRSVIDSLPNWITLNESSAFDENDEFSDEESEFEDEDSDEFDEDAYSSESKETNLSDEELPGKPVNSDHLVPASFTTPVKLFAVNNIFSIPNAIPPHAGDELEN